ncbi:MAG: glutaredoxin 3 [Candidatus Paceibacteria bacterium]|jgi:glutaredoxin
MLNLYYKESCPFCQRVLEMAKNLGVEFELKDIEDDAAIAAELIEKGGKRQVPYLVDTEKDTAMYESGDIIDYIRENYAGTATAVSKPRVHMSDSTCVSCEG